MATVRTFAYNSGAGITGTTQVGYIAAGATADSYGAGLTWWKGPDEDLGYVICHTSGARTAGQNEYVVPAPTIGFWRTLEKTDNSFVAFCNSVFKQNFANAIDTSIWLTNNGYWSSYLAPVLYLDAGNTSSYPGTGTTWTDLVGGKTFNLINSPTYSSADGGKINFIAGSSQYAQCNTSLPSLPTFTTAVWHYWNGTNTGTLPCILTEIYPGSTSKINYFLGNLQGSVAQSGYFNGGFQVSPQFTLSANTWYNIVTTCDSSQVVKVYVNNTLISTTTTTGSAPVSSNGGIRLMRRWDNAEYWGGYLSTVQIYDKALDSGQVSSIWNSTKSRYGL